MGNWLADYLAYTANQEAPEELRLWCGILTMGAVLNRKVWTSRSHEGVEFFKDFPGQLCVVIVSEPGEGKKTTALRLPKEMMSEAGVQLFTGRISNERLLHKLGNMPNKRAVMTIVASELSTLLTRAQYNDGLVDNLTKLFDCEDDEYETHSHGHVYLRNVCLTLGAASTPESIGRSIPTTAQGTGFLSRLLVVYSPRSARENPLVPDPANPPDPQILANNAFMRQSLVSRLKQYTQYAGPFEWTREASEWYINWYHRRPSHGIDGYEIPRRPKGAGWPERLPSHLIRVAMCIEIAGTNGMKFNSGSLMTAEQMLREHISNRFRYSLAYIGRHAEAEGQERILALFREKRRLTTADIVGSCRRYFRDINALRAAIYTLRVSQVIEIKENETWELICDPDLEDPQ